jgi:TM2 domain-containing membrane protein YozV
MAEEVVSSKSPDVVKNPIYAFIMSFFIPGLGQAYNGQVKKAFFILIGTLIGSLLFLIPGLIVWIYGLYDAYKTSKAINEGKIEYNESKYFILFLIIAIITGIIYIFLLAAVIAAFVFGMAGTTMMTKSVGVIEQKDVNGNIVITWSGGSDFTEIESWYATDGSNQKKIYISQRPPSVGDQVTILKTQAGNRIVIIAQFKDGSSQVLLDKNI